MNIISPEDIQKSKNDFICAIDEFISSIDMSNEEARKRANNFFQWAIKYINYIKNENSFKCDKEESLVRGAVVWVEFGFNIGNEFGGKHPAIILWKTDSSLFVAPLSSREPTEKKDYNVKVEKVYGLKNMVRWTNVLKICNISIQRVDTTASIGNVKGKVLDDITISLIKYIFSHFHLPKAL